MNFRGSLLVVFFISSVYCEKCIRYDFEEKFDSLFDQEGMCAGNYDAWKLGNYSSTSIDRPNAQSEKFISPLVDMSCASSFPFVMSDGGSIEVNFFINSANFVSLARLYVFAEEIVVSGDNVEVGVGVYSSWDIEYENGWHTLSFRLNGKETFNGHVIFMGSAHTNSSLLIDSFVYKPATYEGECLDTTTTTEVPTTLTPEPETESTTVNATEPTTVDATEPTTVEETEPTTVEITEPTTIEVTEPTTIEVTEPTTTEVTEPTTIEVTKPTTVEVTKPTTVEVTKPTTIEVTKPTTEDMVSTSIPTIVTRPEPTRTSPSVTTVVTSVPEVVQTTSFPKPTPVAPENRCPDDPLEHRLLPHEKYCGLFYYCVWGSKVLTECPPGLHFNPVLQVCDWPLSAGCTSGK